MSKFSEFINHNHLLHKGRVSGLNIVAEGRVGGEVAGVAAVGDGLWRPCGGPSPPAQGRGGPTAAFNRNLQVRVEVVVDNLKNKKLENILVRLFIYKLMR